MAKSKQIALVPASARMPAARSQPIQNDVPQSIRNAITQFEAQVGGRKALIEALSSADAAEDVQEVLSAIADPKHDHEPLAKLCARAGVSPGQLFGAFKTAALVRGQILGALKASTLVPTIVDEIGKTALPYDEPCERCNGAGYIESEDRTGKDRPCGACNGVGSIHYAGNLDQQRTILELAGLITKGSGTNVNIHNANIAPPAAITGGSLEQLQQAVGDLLYVKPVAVDAELLKEPS